MAKGSTEVSGHALPVGIPPRAPAVLRPSTARSVLQASCLPLPAWRVQWASLHSITFFGTGGARRPAMQGRALLGVANSVCTFAVFLALFVVSRRISTLLDDRRTVPFAAACLGAGAACFAAGGLLGASSPLIFAGKRVHSFRHDSTHRRMGARCTSTFNPRGRAAARHARGHRVLGGDVLRRDPSAAGLGHGRIRCAAIWARSRRLGGAPATLLADSSSAWGAKEKLPMEKSPALFFVCIAVFSIPYNCLRGSEDMQAVLADAQPAWSCVLAVVIVAMVAVALAEYAAERRGVLLVPSAVLFLLSAAMVLHLMGNVSPSFIVPSFLYAGYYLFLAMVYLALGPLVATTDANPGQVVLGRNAGQRRRAASGIAVGRARRVVGRAGGGFGGNGRHLRDILRRMHAALQSVVQYLSG